MRLLEPQDVAWAVQEGLEVIVVFAEIGCAADHVVNFRLVPLIAFGQAEKVGEVIPFWRIALDFEFDVVLLKMANVYA